jgi:hypothetical protein
MLSETGDGMKIKFKFFLRSELEKNIMKDTRGINEKNITSFICCENYRKIFKYN